VALCREKDAVADGVCERVGDTLVTGQPHRDAGTE
jgi:hypothetical protein